MIMIETNMTPGGVANCHNVFKYEPIEKQVFNMMKDKFGEDFSYDFSEGYFRFVYRDIQFSITIKKNVKVEAKFYIDQIDDWSGYREVGDRITLPKITIPWNQNVEKKLVTFVNKVNKTQKLIDDMRPFMDKFDALKESDDEIRDYLNKSFSNCGMKCSYWNYSRLDGRRVSFIIHPKDSAPADGVYIRFEHNTHEPVVDGDRGLDHAFRRMDYEDGIEGMKKKIKDFEGLQKKFEAFDPHGNDKLKRTLEANDGVRKLLDEY